MSEPVNVVVGVPIHRAGAYILDRFLANQREIQQKYPASELVFATVEDDFADELDAMLVSAGIRGQVLRYKTVKPAHARSRAWNIACGREAIRGYVLSQTSAQYLLCLDSDMTFDPAVIEIMEREIQRHDAVFSGYVTKMGPKWGGLALTAGGCCMLTRSTVERLIFRCIEFRNGGFLYDDTMLELDLMRARCRTRKGFFVSTSHYRLEGSARHLHPQRVGMVKRMANTTIVRYPLIRCSVMLERDIPLELRAVLRGLLDTLGRRRPQASDEC
ncbi:MAG: hypothetical protein SVP26_01255 [Chloroflexota bacterium]|nr:hypothetical protein [Chloroflexota bacterium]